MSFWGEKRQKKGNADWIIQRILRILEHPEIQQKICDITQNALPERVPVLSLNAPVETPKVPVMPMMSEPIAPEPIIPDGTYYAVPETAVISEGERVASGDGEQPTAELDWLRKELERVTAELRFSQDVSQQFASKCEQLRVKYEETRDKYEEMREGMEKSRDNTGALEQELNVTRQNAELLRHNLKDIEVRLSQQQSAQEKERRDLLQSLDRTQRRADRLDKKRLELERNLAHAQSENRTYQQENDRLNDLLKQMDLSEKNLLREGKRLQMDIKDLKDQLATAKKCLNQADEEMNALRRRFDPFQSLLKMYGVYRTLPGYLRDDLQHILPDGNPKDFLLYGSQFAKVRAFCEHVGSQAESMRSDILAKLRMILRYFLDEINSTYEEPVYKLMDDVIGMDFDERFHQRGSVCSRGNGRIEEMLWPGIHNLSEDVVECKALITKITERKSSEILSAKEHH